MIVNRLSLQNAFWTLSGTDVYDALSWDRLHAYHLGLFGDHLLAHLRDLVKSPRESVVTIDLQYATISSHISCFQVLLIILHNFKLKLDSILCPLGPD